MMATSVPRRGIYNPLDAAVPAFDAIPAHKIHKQLICGILEKLKNGAVALSYNWEVRGNQPTAAVSITAEIARTPGPKRGGAK
jgi:hypothetical protein